MKTYNQKLKYASYVTWETQKTNILKTLLLQMANNEKNHLMSSENKKETLNLSKYIYDANKLRNDIEKEHI